MLLCENVFPSFGGEKKSPINFEFMLNTLGDIRARPIKNGIILTTRTEFVQCTTSYFAVMSCVRYGEGKGQMDGSSVFVPTCSKHAKSLCLKHNLRGRKGRLSYGS